MSGKMCAKSRSHERAVIISDTGRGEVTGLTVSSMGLEVRQTRAELQLCHQVLSLEPSMSPSLASYLICEVGGGVQCPHLAGTTCAHAGASPFVAGVKGGGEGHINGRDGP